MIDLPEILVLLRLLMAHVLADFILQPARWIESRLKHGVRSHHLYLHIAVVGVLTYVLLADWTEWLLPLFIVVTHWGLDWWKSTRAYTTRNFIIDQTGHTLVILIGWLWYTDAVMAGGHFLAMLFSNPAFWIILLSYIIAIRPLGFLIAQITARWQQELAAAEGRELAGLQNAGMWIGRLERFLILTLILLNQYSAIGFLIAAKSVFRFSGHLDGIQERKEVEYILIGTLLSFALAIALGIGTRYLLQEWGGGIY